LKIELNLAHASVALKEDTTRTSGVGNEYNRLVCAALKWAIVCNTPWFCVAAMAT